MRGDEGILYLYLVVLSVGWWSSRGLCCEKWIEVVNQYSCNVLGCCLLVPILIQYEVDPILSTSFENCLVKEFLCFCLPWVPIVCCTAACDIQPIFGVDDDVERLGFVLECGSCWLSVRIVVGWVGALYRLAVRVWAFFSYSSIWVFWLRLRFCHGKVCCVLPVMESLPLVTTNSQIWMVYWRTLGSLARESESKHGSCREREGGILKFLEINDTKLH